MDLFVILDDVQYTKGSWRNRHKIRTRDGWQWLTVPVYQKGRSGQLIKNVRIDNTKKWAARHWHCLKENYSQAPYWEHYAPFFERLYRNSWHCLVDLNMEIIYFCLDILCISTEVVLASTLGLDENFQMQHCKMGDVNDRNIFYVNKLGGNRFYEGALGKTFLNPERFQEAGIEIVFQNYSHPVYRQQFKPFIPFLSIVDLLFNQGSDSKQILLEKES